MNLVLRNEPTPHEEATMKKLLALIGVILLLGGSIGSTTAEGTKSADTNKAEAKQEIKREEIDTMAKEAVDRVIAESEGAKNLQKKAVGYAVFDNLKFTLLLGSAGGGVGVAVDKATGKRTYMKMATGGPALGLGGQKYQIVFFFETPEVLKNFVEKGYQAEAGMSAVAGKAGANAEATFRDGLAYWVLSEGGLMIQADITGTKYWKYDKLNV